MLHRRAGPCGLRRYQCLNRSDGQWIDRRFKYVERLKQFEQFG
jgi:hypothetical protein